MKKWICLTCGKYKKIVPEHLKTGQIVCFYQFKIDAEEIQKIIKHGIILKRKNKILTILDDGEIFYLLDRDVYPIDAPVYFIYNMFGKCRCLYEQ
ncbi:hypothetical protein GCM10025882_39700 [Acinetobacter gyllenbergii]|uniref:Uncharacterized protein n=1 Tax=Acinetobacter gyllenbergii CIP 110306 = MTCC 11365 TaxID=1217657 RepID=A0A829HEY0_9GAMM|nr:hypothetical protein [Acinetobacter gyllenbergii]EPF80196.1 hypothetical protein F957_02269 [Acinetobacter gyllenbergii CIP 110306 = MTCC 11365]ESK53278.1 hypothetical protein F987_01204 [Acinetobacter gyllenbergii NIPH 230]MCU4580440.1 hypothetical protein [Acinetobacter gyllenbergii]OBY74932.1 hypothetical protein NG55_08365 [Acinetobacter gyllenbergii]GMA13543.1 hypothetical protein GCM10025882_39700 [Acinetobacter gyllenbergii]